MEILLSAEQTELLRQGKVRQGSMMLAPTETCCEAHDQERLEGTSHCWQESEDLVAQGKQKLV